MTAKGDLLDGVTGQPVARRRFATAPAASAGARTWAAAQLAAYNLPDVVLDDVALVLGEMVANAVTHTGGPTFSVSLSVDDAVTVVVEDGEPGFPTLRAATDDDVTGRGMRIIDALALTWGVTTTRGGKAVWARLDRAA